MHETIRMLIVEDDDEDHDILMETIREIDGWAIRACRAATVGEARTLAARVAHDLCLCDYRIGAANGVDFIRHLEDAGIDLPVIMVTDQDEREVEAIAADAGAFDYIPKRNLSANRLNTAIRYTIAKKTRDDMRRARDDAERVATLHSAFLSLMGHELRTPINGVIGFCELMQAEIHGELGSDKYREYLSGIHESGDRLRETVESILDFANLIAGTANPNDDLIEPATEIAYCVGSFADAMRQKALAVRIEADDPARLVADRRSLRKALSNLLSNAIKFSKADDTIVVAFSTGARNECRFEVRDGGKGIPCHAVEHVLLPFRQHDEGLGRQFEGIGLGLPLVRSLMELHGGQVEVGKTAEGGARVTLVFPEDRTVTTGASDFAAKQDAVSRTGS